MVASLDRRGPPGRRRGRGTDPWHDPVHRSRAGARPDGKPVRDADRLTDSAGLARAERDAISVSVSVAVGVRLAFAKRVALGLVVVFGGGHALNLERSSGAQVATALDALLRRAGRLLVVADFDGTLTRGSRDPGAARIEPGARRALRRLAGFAEARPERLAIAILTGRTVVDVATRARVGGIEYLGDHGLQVGSLGRGQRAERIRPRFEPGYASHAAAAEALATGVAQTLGSPPWLFVERKGPSVAFHVRQADDIPAAHAAVLAAVETVERSAGLGDHGLAPYRGRSVVDLRPGGAAGKHEAMERLIERDAPRAVVVFGDDLSDAEAFDAVIEARSAGRIAHGLVVAVHGRLPAPAEVLERADIVLGSSRDVARALAAIGRTLRSS